MDPNFAGTYGDLSTLYRYQGHYDLWLDALKKNATLNDSQEDLALVNEIQPIYKQSGYKAAVNRIIELYKKRRERSYVDPGFIAEEYAFLGDKDHALEWLEKAYQEKTDEMATSYLINVRSWCNACLRQFQHKSMLLSCGSSGDSLWFA
jgi:tetratricopeptide (TPR) repeat protein